MLVALFSWSLSKIQTSVPSSLTSFHHLKPTRILPETFLTNQKSKAFNITTIIKINAPETPNIPKIKKQITANALNNNVNNTIPGFVACCKKFVKSIESLCWPDDICWLLLFYEFFQFFPSIQKFLLV